LSEHGISFKTSNDGRISSEMERGFDTSA